MSKVFIVTDEEIAAYGLAHQQALLDAMESVAVQHPEATMMELLAYARQELVLKDKSQEWDYSAVSQVPSNELAIEAPEPEPEYIPEPEIEEPIEYIPEPVFPTYVVEEYQPEEPVYVPEPAYEPAPVFIEVEDVPEEIAEEEEEDITDPKSLAFRKRKYQGLFHEASKLDEI